MKSLPKMPKTPKTPAGGGSTGAFMKTPSNGKGMSQKKGTSKAPGDGSKWPPKNPA